MAGVAAARCAALLGARGTPSHRGLASIPLSTVPGQYPCLRLPAPGYKGVYSFANDFPALTEVSAPEVGEGLFR